jgi:hypothetical protein
MNRVNAYLNSVADLLAAEAEAASHSGHRTTVGHNREHFAANFLNRHLPSRLQAQLGGTVVSHSGRESSQIDVLVTNDLGLRFEANSTPFVMTEAVAAAISVKSTLNKAAIHDSLDGLLSIPEPSPDVLSFPLLRNDPLAAFKAAHPTLWVFAYKGLSSGTCLEHLRSFLDNRQIDANTRGRICIVVNRKYTISYHVNESTAEGGTIDANTFHASKDEGDDRGYPLARLTNNISSYMNWLGHMSFGFAPYFK